MKLEFNYIKNNNNNKKKTKKAINFNYHLLFIFIKYSEIKETYEKKSRSREKRIE
jgi:hypothetical protein